MKNFLTTALLTCAAVFAFAQKVKHDQVPQPVKDALYKMYPNAKVTEWEMEDGNYEAEFENNDAETSVVFSPAGLHVMTEVEISIDLLPQAAKDYIAANCPGKKISEACKMTTADGDVSYEAEVGGKDYLFDANGVYTGTEGDDDKEDEDN